MRLISHSELWTLTGLKMDKQLADQIIREVKNNGSIKVWWDGHNIYSDKKVIAYEFTRSLQEDKICIEKK